MENPPKGYNTWLDLYRELLEHFGGNPPEWVEVRLRAVSFVRIMKNALEEVEEKLPSKGEILRIHSKLKPGSHEERIMLQNLYRLGKK